MARQGKLIVCAKCGKSDGTLTRVVDGRPDQPDRYIHLFKAMCSDNVPKGKRLLNRQERRHAK